MKTRMPTKPTYKNKSWVSWLRVAVAAALLCAAGLLIKEKQAALNDTKLA